MGFSIPAAIGAKVGQPDRTVWAIDGDGCFQMTAQELVTASVENIPIKVALLNNSYLGMVRQWQEMFYEERYSEVYLVRAGARLREVGRGDGLRRPSGSRRPRRSQPAIEKANEINDRPVVIEFRTDARENVFPMVPPGKTNTEVVVDPSQEAPMRPMSDVVSTDRSPHRSSSWSRTRPGVLARVAGLFARRGFNIESLAVAPTDDERFSRITIVVDVESAPLEQIVKQLNKLINVVEDQRARPPATSVRAELMLATVAADARSSAARSSSWSTCSRARSSTWATTS